MERTDLNLNEIMLYDASGNVMTRENGGLKSYWISSYIQGHPEGHFDVDACFDQDTGPGVTGEVACHTAGDSDPSPSIGARFACPGGNSITSLSRIEVYNRENCCQERMLSFKAEVRDPAGTVTAVFTFDEAQPVYTFLGECENA